MTVQASERECIAVTSAERWPCQLKQTVATVATSGDHSIWGNAKMQCNSNTSGDVKKSVNWQNK